MGKVSSEIMEVHFLNQLASPPSAPSIDAMCDECVRLGSPWLPGLHGGKPRPRPKVRRAKPDTNKKDSARIKKS